MINLKLVHEHTKTLHILYVEDNDMLRMGTVQVLNSFFNVVDIAINGQDGIDKYKIFQDKNKKPYDLVISDINMPHLNGIEMSREILKIEPTQSIIFMTAYNEAEYLHQAIKFGISSFLLKPLKFQDLTTVFYKVCQAITDRKLVNQYYEMIETINQQLENQNKTLEKKCHEQEKLIRILNTMEVKVLNSFQRIKSNDIITTEENPTDNKQINQFIRKDLLEFQELHEELDFTIISIINGNQELISKLHNLFYKYTDILNGYKIFDALSTAMNKFIEAMEQEPFPKNQNKIQEIFMCLEAFMYILEKWQKSLVSDEDEKVKLIDISLVKDMETITKMWLTNKEYCEV